MYKRTPVIDWSNQQTASIASVYKEDFTNLLRDKKSLYKSVKDVSESFKDLVILQTARENDYITEFVSDLEHVNWAEIATTFVLNNPIWIDNYT
jgi:hypothetical protein